MAKWFNASKKIGQVGGSVFYIDKGQVIERSRAAVVRNPRTIAQQTQRVKWSNIVHFWGASSRSFDKGFIAKKPNQSYYNAFMGANLMVEPINFPRDFADMKASVVAPYIISSGNLPPITATKPDSTAVLSSLEIGLGSITSLGNLSQRIIQYNDNWMNGDKLCVFVFRQLMSDSGYPFMEVYRDSIVLDIASTATLQNWSVRGLRFLAYANEKVSTFTDIAGVAFVHTRKNNGVLTCSTQSVVMTSNYYLDFVGPEALARALASYNAKDHEFLEPVYGAEEHHIII